MPEQMHTWLVRDGHVYEFSVPPMFGGMVFLGMDHLFRNGRPIAICDQDEGKRLGWGANGPQPLFSVKDWKFRDSITLIQFLGPIYGMAPRTATFEFQDQIGDEMKLRLVHSSDGGKKN
jgi:hypothetical protein